MIDQHIIGPVKVIDHFDAVAIRDWLGHGGAGVVVRDELPEALLQKVRNFAAASQHRLRNIWFDCSQADGLKTREPLQGGFPPELAALITSDVERVEAIAPIGTRLAHILGHTFHERLHVDSRVCGYFLHRNLGREETGLRIVSSHKRQEVPATSLFSDNPRELDFEIVESMIKDDRAKAFHLGPGHYIIFNHEMAHASTAPALQGKCRYLIVPNPQAVL